MTDETVPTLNPNTPIPADEVLATLDTEEIIGMMNSQGLALQATRDENIEALKTARDTVSPVAPAAPDKPFEVVVDGVPESEPMPASIAMQPPSEDTAPLPPDDENGVLMVEAPAAAPKPMPVQTKTEMEIAAGRAKVQEHEGRTAMIAGKEADNTPEGEKVANAREQNKDL
jgi:hypothetical protein